MTDKLNSQKLNKSFVFENIEVVPTGRIAKKTIELSTRSLIEILVEIKPMDPTAPQWKKWVKRTDLYEVTVESDVE